MFPDVVVAVFVNRTMSAGEYVWQSAKTEMQVVVKLAELMDPPLSDLSSALTPYIPVSTLILLIGDYLHTSTFVLDAYQLAPPLAHTVKKSRIVKKVEADEPVPRQPLFGSYHMFDSVLQIAEGWKSTHNTGIRDWNSCARLLLDTLLSPRSDHTPEHARYLVDRTCIGGVKQFGIRTIGDGLVRWRTLYVPYAQWPDKSLLEVVRHLLGCKKQQSSLSHALGYTTIPQQDAFAHVFVQGMKKVDKSKSTKTTSTLYMTSDGTVPSRIQRTELDNVRSQLFEQLERVCRIEFDREWMNPRKFQSWFVRLDPSKPLAHRLMDECQLGENTRPYA